MTEKPFILFKSFKILIAALIVTALIVRVADYKLAPGRFDAKKIYMDLKDSSRDRGVLVKIHYPAFGTSSRPSKHPWA